MTELPRIFVASSKEALTVAEAVNIKLDGFARVKQWDNAFDLSTLTLPALISRTKDTDFAVFVFHKDDKTIIRENEFSAVRDNVVFELGLFIGALGLEKCFVLVPKSTENEFRIPTDLSGLTIAAYDDTLEDMTDAVTASCAKIKQTIRRINSASAQTLASQPDSAAQPTKNDPIQALESELWRARIDMQQVAEKHAALQNAVVSHFLANAKPATEAEIKSWTEGAKHNYSEPFRIDLHNTYYLDQDAVVPSMHGARSFSVLVAAGTRVFGLDQWSHNNIYFMDGFRKYGR